MNLNLEWLKKHKLAAGAAILLGLIVLFVLLRKSGSSSGGDLASLAANNQQGQLQLAELSAQEGSQQDQLNTQLASQEYATSAQEQENQDQLAASIAGSILPAQVQSEFESPIYQQELSLYGQEISGETAEQESLLPLETAAQTLSESKNNNTAEVGESELAVLLGEASSFSNKFGNLTTVPGSSGPSSIQIPFGLTAPSQTGLLGQLGTGLFA